MKSRLLHVRSVLILYLVLQELLPCAVRGRKTTP
jgi:hypothetical protein